MKHEFNFNFPLDFTGSRAFHWVWDQVDLCRTLADKELQYLVLNLPVIVKLMRVIIRQLLTLFFPRHAFRSAIFSVR